MQSGSPLRPARYARRAARASAFSLSVLSFGLTLGFAQRTLPALDDAASDGTEGAPTLQQYLPAQVQYDGNFPRPESVLGWPVGTWHVRHDQLVRWFEVVAEASPRVTLMEYGRTHEGRPLLLAAVTSPRNHASLEDIREAHVKAVRSGAEAEPGPAIAWMGYGVHGNESSASNASMLLLYHLAAARGPEMSQFLENTVVLIDPCINPDGGARFAHWANMHKGKNLVGMPSHREHVEAWPGGRTNHYWFDLNRDWLLLTHPESRGRIAQFQRWLPTVLTDYHEMGSGSTYFFQPGIPTRRNPLTPERNHDLTAKIATYHAAALDQMGSLYFTEERFDDFYYGKGSTYPDVQGSIGILFEQASSRGHLMSTSSGELSFPFTIKNQFTTSLTTLKAVDEMRAELGDYQRGFYRDAEKEGKSYETAAWSFGFDDATGSRTDELANLLMQHGIRVHVGDPAVSGTTLLGRLPYVVPAAQPQFRLIRALFEKRTSWDDNTFYDVSSWTFPESFDLEARPIPRSDWNPAHLGFEVEAFADSLGKDPLSVMPGANDAGCAIQWDSLVGPQALGVLHAAGVRTRVIQTPFEVPSPVRGEPAIEHGRGTILVTMGGQPKSRADITAALAKVHAMGLRLVPIQSGLIPTAPDLGSGSFPFVERPEVVLAVGQGVSAYEAGAIWHDLDVRVGVPVSLVERDRLARTDLSDATHLILVNGTTTGWGEDEEEFVNEWVRDGGILIATKRSALWAAEHLMSKAKDGDHDHGHGDKEDSGDDEAKPARPSYADYEGLRAEQRIAGTIFRADVDNAHPIAWGLKDTIPVFRDFEEILPEGNDPFATPVRYTAEPLVSGFASADNVKKIAGTPAIRVERLGAGTVIAMVDNPCFRGVWYGTRRFLVNALFFGGAVSRTGPIGDRNEDEAMDYDHGHAHDR